MKTLFSLLLALIISGLHATDTTTVYFDSGEFSLNTSETKILNQGIEFHRDLSLDSISLSGHTDNTGSQVYNRDLSQKRVQGIKTDLMNTYTLPINTVYQTDFETVFGDSNQEKSKERYVQIIWYYRSEMIERKEVVSNVAVDSLSQSEEFVNDMITSFKPKALIAAFNPKEEKVIQTEGGNLLLIQKETFVRKDGSSPENVNLIVEEYKTPTAFLAAGFRTMTTSGQLLETGGMLNLKATDEKGEELTMKKSMTVGFKRNMNRTDNPGMRLYDGVKTDNGVEWKETENLGYKKPFKFDYEKLFFDVLDYAGEQNDIALSVANVTKTVYQSTNKFKNIKDLKGEDKKMILKAVQEESVYLIKDQVETKLEEKKQKEEEENNKTKETIEDNEYYFTNTTNLGSLNCDSPIYDDVYTDGRCGFLVGRKVAAKESERIYLFFKGMNSYILGQPKGSLSRTFLNVPKGKDAIIIGIKAKGDHLYLATKEIVTSKKGQELNYRECTKKELEQKMNSLMDI